MLELAHPRQQHARAARLLLEVANDLRDGRAEEVVREHHDDALSCCEAAGEPECLGDAARPLLDRVVDLVGEVLPKVLHVIRTRHEQQVRDARLAEEVDGPLDHRLLSDGEKMLVGDAGKRIEPRARPAREDDAFHQADAKRPRSAETA
jgi:hypothetical protein